MSFNRSRSTMNKGEFGITSGLYLGGARYTGLEKAFGLLLLSELVAKINGYFPEDKALSPDEYGHIVRYAAHSYAHGLPVTEDLKGALAERAEDAGVDIGIQFDAEFGAQVAAHMHPTRSHAASPVDEAIAG